jgi:hypothetical protein
VTGATKWEESDMNRGTGEINLRENHTSSHSNQINHHEPAIIRIPFVHTPIELQFQALLNLRFFFARHYATCTAMCNSCPFSFQTNYFLHSFGVPLKSLLVETGGLQEVKEGREKKISA